MSESSVKLANFNKLQKEAADLLEVHNRLINDYNNLRMGFLGVLYNANPEKTVSFDIKDMDQVNLDEWVIRVRKEATSDLVVYRLVPREELPEELPFEPSAPEPSLEVCEFCKNIKTIGESCVVCDKRVASVIQMVH